MKFTEQIKNKDKRAIGILVAIITVIVALIVTLVVKGTNNKASIEPYKKGSIQQIEVINEKDWLLEDREKIKKLKEETIEKIRKADNEKEIKEEIAKFNKKLAEIPNKKAKQEAFEKELKKSIEGLEGEDKEKALAIIEEEKKNGNINSAKDINNISKTVAEKIEKQTGKEVQEITAEKVIGTAKTETPTKKTVVISIPTKPDKPNKTPSKPTPKPQPKPSKPTPEKKKVWVVDKPAKEEWTEKVVYEGTSIVSKYTCCGKIFESLEEASDYYVSHPDDPLNEGWYPIDVEVPWSYTEEVKHPAEPEEGHWEWK